MSVIFLVVIAIAAFALVAIYNQLVRARNLVKNSFSQIDVQLKRRYDLIPNLVETAKGYLKHEQQTLQSVIEARNQAYGFLQKVQDASTNPQGIKDLFQADGMLSQALSRLMVSVEAYPQLKADATMSRVMEELTSTENKISFARQAYNDSVMSYNNMRETFPNNLLSGQFGFMAAAEFQVTRTEERENVRVQF